MHRAFRTRILQPGCRDKSSIAECKRTTLFQTTTDSNMKLFLLIVLLVAGANAAGPTKCNECLADDKASCLNDQKDDQKCPTDRKSLGTTHCATAVGKYLNDEEGHSTALPFFFRGCINCESKKEACFALGGWLKGDNERPLLQCEIECCTGDNCNNQTVPTLSKDAITVFTPNASGLAECYLCFGSNATTCSKDQKKQNCSADIKSLGTTHCGSAVGKYRDSNGNVTDGFFRGCINCADKKAACAAISGLLVDEESLRVMECNIECCDSNNCNTGDPSLATTGRPSATTVSATRQGDVIFNGVLSFALAFGNILYHL